MASALRPTDSAGATLAGLLVLGLAAGAALVQMAAARPRHPLPLQALTDPVTRKAARTLHAATALLATSVLADSALEHYRGAFRNPGMLAPLLTALLTVFVSARATGARGERSGTACNGIYATAALVGGAGLAFHAYDIVRRPGGLSWLNLFYAAPVGAPAALSLAGLFGLAAQRLRRNASAPAQLLKRPADRVLSALTSVGLAGTTAEAALLHFRGAYQNPFMWLPVTLPPVAAALMAHAAAGPQATSRQHRFTRQWLRLTALIGLAGSGFHAWGIARQMGGWRNWRQNLLSGPPLPAPPSFSALALAGLAALSLAGAKEAAA